MSGDAEMSSASQAQSAGGRQYHLDVAPGEVARHILLVGDPDRAQRVAAQFDAVRVERRHREFVTITGTHRGLEVTVVGTGISAANMEITMVELSRCVDDPVLIRCGSSGGLSSRVGLGDLVIAAGAVRMEDTSTRWVESGYPAVAHHEVVLALLTAAGRVGAKHHVGLTATASGFYGAQGRPFGALQPRDAGRVERLTQQGVLNLEMEVSCLLTLASLQGIRAGAVCAVFATRHDDRFASAEQRADAEARVLEVGLEALHAICALDAEKGTAPHWAPSLGAEST